VELGTQGPTLELQVGEQSTREVPLAEEADDDMELKLPQDAVVDYHDTYQLPPTTEVGNLCQW